jgi:hypothetical protein
MPIPSGLRQDNVMEVTMGKVLWRALLLSLLTIGVIGTGIILEGRRSGWTGLARQFPGHSEGSGLTLVVEEGGVGNPRWFHRVAPLQASMGLGGLRLSYPFPYSLGHRPLLIPWTQLRVLDATVEDGRTWVLLSVSLPERARVSLKGDVGAVVQEWLVPAR